MRNIKERILAVTFLFLLLGMGGMASPVRTTVTLDWLGHACFLVRAERLEAPRPIPLVRKSRLNYQAKSRPGFRFVRETCSLLFDPYGAETGYPVKPVKVDAVFVSHEHFDHNNVGMAPGAKIYRGLKDEGKAWNIFHVPLAPGIWLSTVGTYHDREKGKQRGLNAVSVLDVFGLRIVHLGDLGHLLSSQQKRAIGRVDILLVPVGGVFTIDGKEAREVVSQLKPRVVIPMHYRTSYTNPRTLPIHGVEDFLSGICWPVKRVHASRLIFSPGHLPKQTTVYVLEPLLDAPAVAL